MGSLHNRHRWLVGLALVILGCLALLLQALLETPERAERESAAPAQAIEDGSELRETQEAAALSATRAAEAEREAESSARAEDGALAEGRIELRVRVADRLGRPVASARVTVFEPTELVGRTDADGRCALPIRDLRESVRVRAEAQGFAHVEGEFERRGTAAFELALATVLAGRVLAADTGEPVPGARLALDHESCDHCTPDVAVSDLDGRYEFLEVPLEASTWLAIEADGFVPERREIELRASAEDTEQDIFLARGLELRGRVTDWTSGAGLSGARVSGATTDEDGRFACRVLPDLLTGKTTLEVRAEGHATLRVVLEADPPKALELELPRLAFVEGKVTENGGPPIGSAEVRAAVDGPAPGSAETSPLYELPRGWRLEGGEPALADASGNYRLAVLPWSLNVGVAADATGFVDSTRRFRRIGEPGSSQGADFVLLRDEAAPRLTGVVRLNGRTSRTLTGTVTWRGPTQRGAARFEGSYELTVEPGEIALSFLLDRAGKLEGSEATVRARAGERVQLDADLRAPLATITGRVRAGEAPAEDATVVARCFEARGQFLWFGTRTDENGDYELIVPDVGATFTVDCTRHGEQAEARDIRAGARAVDFDLGRAHPLLVRMVDGATGAELRLGEHVVLYACPNGGTFVEARAERYSPDAGGWYELWLPANRIDLVVQPKGDFRATKVVYGIDLARADGPTRLELVLELGLSLALELDPESGPWPEGHSLHLLETGLSGSVYRHGVYSRRLGKTTPELGSWIDGLLDRRRLYFDENGRAELTGLEPGSYRFECTPNDVVLDPDEFLLDESTLQPLPVRWTPR